MCSADVRSTSSASVASSAGDRSRPDRWVVPVRVAAATRRASRAEAPEEGEWMLLVRNVMTEDVKTVSPDMDAYDAAGLMRSHDVGSAPVVDADGHLVGIVTDRDLVIRVLGRSEERRVGKECSARWRW